MLIRGGLMYDGSGSLPRHRDIVVAGDRIVAVLAPGTAPPATDTIDATGLAVAPGFIDPHVHAEGDLGSADSAVRRAPWALMQGVTTVIAGNDGGGTWRTGETLDRYQRLGTGPNFALLVGHGAVRGTVMGMADREATAAELDSMRTLVAAAMRDGALGMSTGLYYAPGSYAPTSEVIALARIVASAGGIYDTHMRDESSYSVGLRGSVEEVLRIGREAAIPVHISHIKALGVDVWGEAPSIVALLREARASGIDVTANQYPWTASGTGLSAALLPRWSEAGGRDSLLARLRDPAARSSIAGEMRENLRRRGGAASLLMISASGPAEHRAEVRGRTLEEYAALKQLDPVDAAIRIIETGSAGVASFNMTEEDIRNFMREPFVMTGSDGSGGHPRKYGTYPRKIRQYVLADSVITLERMIESATSQVARTFGIADRGRIEAGVHADIIVFDPAVFRENATYLEPTLLPSGMHWVLVNGTVAVADGRLTHALPGRAIRRND